jgi:hypothetical protein
MDGQAWIEWHKKMFQNGAIWLDLVGLSWIFWLKSSLCNRFDSL